MMVMERRQSCLVFVEQIKQVGFKAILYVMRESEFLTASVRLLHVIAETLIIDCNLCLVTEFLASRTQIVGLLIGV